MKPICVNCQRFYRIKQTGLQFLEQMPIAKDAIPGVVDPGGWQPYKLWYGDLWECPDCNAQTIVGVGSKPIAENFHPNFTEQLHNAGGDAVLKINDC